MTGTPAPGTPRDGEDSRPAARGRASYTVRNSSAPPGCGGVSDGLAPAPGEAGETARHRGAPGDRAATGGGPQPEGEAAPRPRRAPRPRLRRHAQRDQVRSVRLTPDELRAVQHAASSVGLTTAGFLADAAVAVARAQHGPGSWLVDQRGLVEELMTATAHLARVGNNLNQVARALNSGGRPAFLDDAVARVVRATDRVESAALRIAKR
ncbi:MobC family plasmid mobilization relaxosome protein [Streptomyces sp. ST2-7A]|uniref:MobC family plasmid mobilization relaxosome protein n=1 Tax=Streptomyces sp. ST2-7A TaxID=2907214 RepID=UPI0035AB9F30